MKRFQIVASMSASIALLALSAGSAEAVVYCKFVGVPKGCVARAGVVYAPAPAARAIATPGVGAPGVGVRAGVPGNRGGAVNRVGRF